jgi:hypothetical protein
MKHELFACTTRYLAHSAYNDERFTGKLERPQGYGYAVTQEFPYHLYECQDKYG